MFRAQAVIPAGPLAVIPTAVEGSGFEQTVCKERPNGCKITVQIYKSEPHERRLPFLVRLSVDRSKSLRII